MLEGRVARQQAELQQGQLASARAVRQFEKRTAEDGRGFGGGWFVVWVSRASDKGCGLWGGWVLLRGGVWFVDGWAGLQGKS